MDSMKICAIALIGVALFAIIKQISANFAFPLRAAVTVLLSSLLLLAADPIIKYINELFNLAGFSKYAAVILKGTGVALLTQACASVCRDCGEASVAGCVELGGKPEIFLLCVPLINEMLLTAQRLLLWA